MFIVGRAIAGAGSSGINNGSLTIISSVLPLRSQAKFLGINLGIGQLGIALGPIIGGAFTQYVSWRWCKCFLIFHQHPLTTPTLNSPADTIPFFFIM